MDRRAQRHRDPAGVSLIEALVALAVVGFGMLAMVGLQANLRFNADLSRQRAEAVRLAQDAMERWRAYGGLRTASVPASWPAFDDIADTSPQTLVVPEVNTLFSRETLVSPNAGASPRLRGVRVVVRWQDRRGELQQVQLDSQIGYVPPELAAVVAQRPDLGPVGRPGNRHPMIPRAAVPLPDAPGSSRFEPPGGAGLGWVFNNDTGLIVAICPPPPATACAPADRLYLAGSFGFAADGPPATSAAEQPSDPLPMGLQLSVVVRYSLPAPGGVENCVVAASPDRRRMVYYCAMPITSTRQWTGTLDPILTEAGGDVRASDTYSPPTAPIDASVPTDWRSTRYRICRYTPVNANRREPEVTVGLSEHAARGLHNRQHPWRYVLAEESYPDRNFLLIRAGDGAGRVYGCPAEDPVTAIDSNTHNHPRMQP
jgi:type II secretory pathway pseudopilin PulG